MSLSQCFSMGLFTWGEYSKWAKNAYHLPVLSDDFLTGRNLSSAEMTELFSQTKTTLNLSPSLVPVAKWDGITYIACLEPPQSTSADYKLLLASPVLIEKIFNSLAPQTQNKVEPKASNAEFSAEDLFAATTVAAPSKTSHEFELSDEVAQAESETEKASEESNLEMLEGLDLTQLAIPPKILKNGNTDSNIDALTPEGLSDPSTATNLFQINKNEKALPVSSEPVMSARPVATTPTTSLNAQMPPAVKKSNLQELPIIVSTPNFLKDTADLYETLKQEIKESYQDVHLLLVNEQQTEAFVVTENLSINQTDTVALDKPSCFAVATTTQKPYHGYVVNSAISEKYFVDWNQAQIPDTITIVPMVNRGIVVALLAAVGGSKTYTSSCLSQVEEAVEQLHKAASKKKAA